LEPPKTENIFHIQPIPSLPLKEESGVFKYPRPHDAYIRKAEEIIADHVSSSDCFLWVIYFPRTFEFKVHFGRSTNGFTAFSMEVEKEIKKAVDFLRNPQ